MRTLSLILGVSAVCLGCSPKNVPLPIAPTAKLEVFAITTADDPAATKAADPASGDPLYLQNPPILTTKDVATVSRSEIDVQTVSGESSGHPQPEITVELTPTGSAKFAAATANSVGKQVAFVVNGEVIGAPKIYSQIQGSFKISGDARIAAAFETLTKP